MALILNIETSTKTCSVNLSKDGILLDYREITSEKYVHSEKLHSLIQETFKSLSIEFQELNAVAVCSGPGSFTGLRIGVASAKGIAFALGIPLISVNSIKIMIECFKPESVNKNAILFPMIDARRQEVYTAGFNSEKKQLTDISCPEINENFITKYGKYEELLFLGEGALKFKNMFKKSPVLIIDKPLNSSRGMSLFTFEKFSNKEFENLSYFNPFYLKDFIPG
jgi:tRNA threonylcarbamoyladenosine biosynthesis protein TsaB